MDIPQYRYNFLLYNAYLRVFETIFFKNSSSLHDNDFQIWLEIWWKRAITVLKKNADHVAMRAENVTNLIGLNNEIRKLLPVLASVRHTIPPICQPPELQLYL